jgi:hypothetical protein
VDVAKNKNENNDKYFSIMIAKKKKWFKRIQFIL